jgi:hypothetical protein
MSQFKNPSKDSVCRHSALRLTVCVLLPVLLLAGCATGKVSQKYPGLMYQTVNSASYPVLYPVMQDAARQGLPPMRVTFNAADAAASDYQLDLAFTIRDKGIHDAEMVWMVMTVFTLGMYPSTCGHFEFILSARLDDREGRHLRTWQVIENDTAFAWLMMGPECTGPDEGSMQKILASLLAELYADMAMDPVLAGAPKPGAAVPPLVFIDVAEDAQAIVGRAVWSEMPFPRVSFEPEARSRADRVIHVEFEYVGPEPSLGSMIGRYGAAMMTIGLVSGCPPNTIILRASVHDATGQVLEAYEYADKLRSSWMDGCKPPEAGLYPEAEAKLLKRMFRTIAKEL